MDVEFPEKLFELISFYNWNEQLNELVNLAQPEKWKNDNAPPPKHSKNKYPILQNYLDYTYRRAVEIYSTSGKCIFHKDDAIIFNTGLYTKQYDEIYALIKLNTKNKGRKKGSLQKFCPEYNLHSIDEVPQRVYYYNSAAELVYDTNKKIVINVQHILADQDNLSRIPNRFKEFGNTFLVNAFTGAIDMAKKRVNMNYKTAVPQYYKGTIQLLLPICLEDVETPDLALVVENYNDKYYGRTCLTMDMAYNNARLITRPDSDWLTT